MIPWTRTFPVIALVAFCLAGPACAQPPATAQAESSQAPAAEVAVRLGDRTITVGDVDRKWLELDAGSYMRSTQERFDIRSRVIEVMIGEYLIDQEAKRRGVTSEQLLAQELPGRTPPVSDTDLETAYAQMKSQMNGATLDQVRPALKSYLERQRRSEAHDQLVEELKAKATGIDVLLDPPRYTVATTADDPVRGPADAPVEIIEFSDFQCPFCGRVKPTLDRLRKQYEGRIKIVFRNFPLTSIHPQAYSAAEAAECARRQGKFWEYHDALFANQRALTPDDLKKHAADLGLDTAAFAACLDGGQAKARVDADLDAAQALGLTSTPAFFVNGRFLSGAQPYEAFDKIVLEELKRAK
jgi:protein-disulfide isomerase